MICKWLVGISLQIHMTESKCTCEWLNNRLYRSTLLEPAKWFSYNYLEAMRWVFERPQVHFLLSHIGSKLYFFLWQTLYYVSVLIKFINLSMWVSEGKLYVKLTLLPHPTKLIQGQIWIFQYSWELACNPWIIHKQNVSVVRFTASNTSLL